MTMQNAGTAKARGENAGTPDAEEEHDDAIANAVCDALGMRDASFTALPVSPERVRSLLR